MKKIIVYGSQHWTGCGPVKELLLQNDIKFAYLDISESLLHLKNFLKVRDTSDAFIPVRESGRVGLPCIVVNGGEEVYLELPEDLQIFKS